MAQNAVGNSGFGSGFNWGGIGNGIGSVLGGLFGPDQGAPYQSAMDQYTKYANQANKDGLWFSVDYESQADKKVFFVEYESQADLKIYFFDYESQAGWRNKSKQHLLKF